MSRTTRRTPLQLLRLALRRTLTIPGFAIWFPALMAMFLASIPTILEGAPNPVIEDEYGYLLSAETFAEGRASNSTHPLWKQFESIHQIQTPSYQSKYPPGQALTMAVGYKLGHPIVGVWFGVGLMVASIVWMLLAWMPRRWAMLGGWVATFQYALIGVAYGEGTFAYWSQSYWGGALAAGGGALLFGGVARVIKGAGYGPSFAIGFGLLIMANTRPLEGLVASLLPCGYLVFWLFRNKTDSSLKTWAAVVLPAAVVLLPGFAAMGWYNKQVTGEVTQMPWAEHHDQYVIFPLFIWQDLSPDRDWGHEQLAWFHGVLERHMHERHSNPKQLAIAVAGKCVRFCIFFVGPFFGLVLLLSAAQMARNRRMWFVLLCVVVVAVVGLLKFNAPPHYNAPAAALVVVLIVQGLRYLSATPSVLGVSGRKIAASLMAASLVMALVGVWKSVENARSTQQRDRGLAIAKLEAIPGDHLVLVSFGENYSAIQEWVFNAADIDASRIVWARDSSPEARAELLAYYPERIVWTLRAGDQDPHPPLVPLSEPQPEMRQESDQETE